MKVQLARTGKTIALTRPQKLFAQERTTMETGFAGDGKADCPKVSEIVCGIASVSLSGERIPSVRDDGSVAVSWWSSSALLTAVFCSSAKLRKSKVRRHFSENVLSCWTL